MKVKVELEESGSIDKNQLQFKDDYEYIAYLTNKISELEWQLEDQQQEILELKRKVHEYCEEIIRMNSLYQGKCEENKNLINQWSSQHCNQHKQIQ
ncbi:14721_t:CDS:2 [Cetraspora pellucida]|uniref:14721_t:CDS:1 n=1 Tax=Cetraspora pellucida TaxID=1433469 RepID=A0A9N9FWY0_9GLOM|nr:14721_t:CDS:2 [Cetraspora pellucida]